MTTDTDHNCDVCDKENITQHNYSYSNAVTDPTCTEAGYTTYTCNCGDSQVADSVAATGHSYKSSVTKEPTCTETGIKTFTCEHDASHTYTEEIKANGHTLVVDEAVLPTCTEEGKTEGTHCSVCNEVIHAQTGVPAKGHTKGEPVIKNKVDSTHYAEGSYDEVVYCSKCKEELSREKKTIAKLDIDVEASEKLSYTVDGMVVTVQSDFACKVGYLNENGIYVTDGITVEKNENGSYSFTAPQDVTRVVLVMIGDVDGNGILEEADNTLLGKALLPASYEDHERLTPKQIFAADVNSNGKLNSADKTLIARALSTDKRVYKPFAWIPGEAV